MKIQVTQEDIDTGCPSAYSCPVALAVCRAIGCNPTEERIGVTSHGITDWDDQSFYTGLGVQEFVRQFDQGKVKPAPFEFDLELQAIGAEL